MSETAEALPDRQFGAKLFAVGDRVRVLVDGFCLGDLGTVTVVGKFVIVAVDGKNEVFAFTRDELALEQARSDTQAPRAGDNCCEAIRARLGQFAKGDRVKVVDGLFTGALGTVTVTLAEDGTYVVVALDGKEMCGFKPRALEIVSAFSPTKCSARLERNESMVEAQRPSDPYARKMAELTLRCSSCCNQSTEMLPLEDHARITERYRRRHTACRPAAFDPALVELDQFDELDRLAMRRGLKL